MTKRYRKPHGAPKWKPKRLKERRTPASPGPIPTEPGQATTVRFYAGQYTPDELALIAACLQDLKLDDEVWMQRVLNLRLLGVAGKLEPGAKAEAAETAHADTALAGDGDQPQGPAADTALTHLVHVAMALATGTGRLARLLRDRRVLSGEAVDGLAGSITAVLDEWSQLLLGETR